MSSSESSKGSASADAGASALVQDCESLLKALGAARLSRLLLLAGFLVFALTSAYYYYSLLNRLRSQEYVESVTGAVQTRLAGQTDTYMKEVQGLVDRSTPVVRDAFYDKAKTEIPALLKNVEHERDEFVNNLKSRTEGLLAAHYDSMVTKNEQLLVQELPELQDEELRKRMVANLHQVFEKMIRKYYADELNGRLVSLYDRWDHFPAVERATNDSTRLEDQFIATLIDLLARKLTENPMSAQSSQ